MLEGTIACSSESSSYPPVSEENRQYLLFECLTSLIVKHDTVHFDAVADRGGRQQIWSVACGTMEAPTH